MDPIKKINFKRPIIIVKILDNGQLLVVDSDTTIRYLNKNTLETEDGFKAKITHERYKVNVVAFSNDGQYFASLSSDCKDSKLYNVQTKKAVARVTRHHGEVSCVGIDPTGRYMFSCGDDGKTFAIDTKSGKMAFTLPVHVDTVNDIAFNHNGHWLATASYDRKISIFNLAMMTPKEKLKIHSAPVMKLQFLSKHRLCSVDKNSTVIILDIYTSKILARLQGVHDDVTQVTKSSDDKFLFLATALGYILVYELGTYTLLSNSYIKLSCAITSLNFDADSQRLIVGSQEGDVFLYDIYEGEYSLKDLLQKKEYDKIEEYAKRNPILQYTKIYNMVSVIWDKTLVQAKIYLENSEKEKAIKIFLPFKNIPSKNKIMQNVILEYAEFDKFAALVKGEKLALAYSMANLHSFYKESGLYKAMEAKWRKAFTLARKYALDPRGTDTAKEILKPYRGISEKTFFVQELLTQGEVYKRFKVSLVQKDFKLAFELIKQHPFLKEFPEYETLTHYADTLYIKSQHFIKKDDTHSAIKLLRILMNFTGFEEEVKSLMLHIEIKQKFYDAIKDEDIIQAYNLLAASEDLQDTVAGQRLQKHWNEDLSEATNYAVEGNVRGIEKALAKYMKIDSKYMAIGTIFGWCYMMQLEQAIRDKKERTDIENGIKNYILCFGLQDQILSFFNIFGKYYPDTKLTLDLQTKGSLSMWRPSMIVSSILD